MNYFRYNTIPSFHRRTVRPQDHAKKLVASLLPKCCASTQPGEALFPNLGRELKASLQPFLGTKKILLKKLVDKWVVTKGPKEDDLRKVDLCVRTVEYKRKDHYECLVFEKGEQTKPQAHDGIWDVKSNCSVSMW